MYRYACRSWPGGSPPCAGCTLIVSVVAVLALMSTPAASPAAEVAVGDGRLVVRGGDASDIVDIRPVGLAYEIYDARDELTAGPGCVSLTAQLAYCTSLVLGVDVAGGGGNDLIGVWDVALAVTADGGEGDDLLESGAGPDSLDGGPGNDALVGGGGDDRLAGDEGNDVLSGGGASDSLEGDLGDDVLSGGDGSRDILLGGLDRDLVRGGPGQDRLDGDQGDDAIIGGAGRDEVESGPGTDQIFEADGRRDTLRCGRHDRVRADPGERPTRCGRLAGRLRVPTVWPPQPASAQPPTAQPAQLPPPDPKVRAIPRRRGSARRITVCIKHAFYVPHVPVKVRTFTRGRRLLKRFKTEGDAGRCRSRKRPGPGRDAFFARARLRGSPW